MTTAANQKRRSSQREQWEAHPNFPSQVLLLGSHDNFRRVSKYLVDHTLSAWLAASKRPPSSHIRNLFMRWKAAMGGHEGYEEAKLYPYLKRRFGDDFGKLKAQHKDLHRIDDEVMDAFEHEDALKLTHSMKAHDQVLQGHLDEEEQLVIPRMLSLSADEFANYVNLR